MKEIIFLSEKGWQAMRQCSLDASQKKFKCSVFIKGRPQKQYIDFISRKKNIKNYFIPRKLYIPSLIAILVIKKIFCNIQGVVIESPRTYKLVCSLKLFQKNIWLTQTDQVPFYNLFVNQRMENPLNWNFLNE